MARMSRATSTKPLVVAHRGASGHLPENTRESFCLGVGMGAEGVEFDIVLSRDGMPVILHDFYLEALTDVREVFPGRERDDGHCWVMDFTWEELQRLRVLPRRDKKGNRSLPGRYDGGDRFRIPSLDEVLTLFRGLERVLDRTLTLFAELKAPGRHVREGLDLPRVAMETLDCHGYSGAGDRCWVVCIESGELKRMRHQLGCELKMLQILGVSEWEGVPGNMEYLRTTEGIKEIAGFAQGIGPWCPLFFEPRDRRSPAPFLAGARARGLEVHPFTFARDLAPPADFASLREWVHYFAGELKVDGLIADHPDAVLQILAEESKPIGLSRRPSE